MKERNYDKMLRHYIVGILSLIILGFLIASLTYPGLIKIFTWVGVVFNVNIILIIRSISSIKYIKQIFFYYTVICIIGMLFILSVLCLLQNDYSMIIHFLCIPIALMVLYSWEAILKWCISLFALIILSIVLVSFFKPVITSFWNPPVMSPRQIFFHCLIALGYCFCIICYCIYYDRQFVRINLESLMQSGAQTEEKTTDTNLDDVKSEQIYNRIIEYFESWQPYLKPDFTISRMANDLGINTSYLSKAISYKQNMNFNTFVNFYRIEKAKEMIQKHSKQYTLQYIYSSCGFQSHSTFNRIFKQQEGVTPTDWIKNGGTSPRHSK